MKKIIIFLCIFFSVLSNAQTELTRNANNARGIGLRGDYLYFNQLGPVRISKINITQSNPTVIGVVNSGLAGPEHMVIAGDFLYFSEIAGGGEIRKIDLTQTNPTPQFVQGSLGTVNGLAIKGNDLYFSSFNKISKFNVTASAPSVITVVRNDISSPKSLFFNGNDLYVSSDNFPKKNI